MLQVEKLSELSAKRREDILQRSMEDVASVFIYVRDLVAPIKDKGDAVYIEQHKKEYGEDITSADFRVSEKEIKDAYDSVDPEIVKALRFSAGNIKKFHEAQKERSMWTTELAPGILAGRMTRPLDIVGAYVPGGRGAYPSSALMNIIPAKVAGVSRVIVTTPPGNRGKIWPEVIVACDIAGAEAIYKIGGPWAVGSLAYGTETIPAVDKIVGPGNRYVTAAKMVVFGTVDIDSPAGPSEGLIIADGSADPYLLSYDFFSQLEHDPDAASVLVTPDAALAEAVVERINRDFETVPRKEIVEVGLKNNSAVLLTDTIEEAVDFSNEYAPEHLQIVTEDPWTILPRIKHAGSIFMGPWAPIPCGDYASGTNHVLPTGRCARMFSGLSIDDFIKKPTFQYLSRQGLEHIKDAVVTLAEAEGLKVHAETVRRRFRSEDKN